MGVDVGGGERGGSSRLYGCPRNSDLGFTGFAHMRIHRCEDQHFVVERRRTPEPRKGSWVRIALKTASRKVGVCSRMSPGVISLPGRYHGPHSSTTSLMWCSRSISPMICQCPVISDSITSPCRSSSYQSTTSNFSASPLPAFQSRVLPRLNSTHNNEEPGHKSTATGPVPC